MYDFANVFGAYAPVTDARPTRAPRARRRTIFDVVRADLALDAPDPLIIAHVATEFPDSKFARDTQTAKRHLAWYKWQLRLKNDVARSRHFDAYASIANAIATVRDALPVERVTVRRRA